MNDIKTIVELANKIKREKYPDSSVALLAGSIIRGEGTKYSDLDIVVIYDSLPFAYRESFVYDGRLVETFVHDTETIPYFMDKFDKPDGFASLAKMIIEGIEIPSANVISKEIKELAQNYFNHGPNKYDAQSLLNMRYNITDLVDDLRDPRNTNEAIGTLCALYNALSEFYFKVNDMWVGKNKYVSRTLSKCNYGLEVKYHKLFQEAFANPESSFKVINLAEELLKPYGGFCFDGYRFDAKPEMRLSSKQIGNTD